MFPKNDLSFSVVIPLFNKEKEIIRTLNSVFAQTKKPDEVIVVDDGSTDNGALLVKEHFNGDVILIKQPNKGVSAARNKGIIEAKNQFVCLLDGDDEWLPGYLEEMSNLITQFPSAIFYSINLVFQNEEGTKFQSAIGVKSNHFGLIEDFPKTFSKGYGLISSSSVCFRKEIIYEGITFPEGKQRGEDIYLWLKMSMIGQLAFSGKPLVLIHLDAQNRSISQKGSVPYQYQWYFAEKTNLKTSPNFQSIRKFIQSNAIISSYGFKMHGDNESVKMIIKLFYKHRDLTFLLIIPALIIPHIILKVIMKYRRAFSSNSSKK